VRSALSAKYEMERIPIFGVYHKPGIRWYGQTKQGKYMTEAGAQEAGYRAA